MVEIYAVKVTRDIDEYEYEKLSAFSSEEKRRRVSKIKKREDAVRTLLADVMLRIILIEKFGLSNIDIAFCNNEYGKPFLKDKSIFFSISHSCQWVSVAVDRKNLGIDIEKIRDVNLNVAKRFFSPDEFEDMMKTSDKIDYFFTLWTLKESYVKALGMGLHIPLNSFTIKIGDEIKLLSEKDNKYHFRQFCVDDEYKMAVCAESNLFCNEINVVNIDEIFNFI
ncbi:MULTISPECIES: 4'-phosphopantetheinyl transferase family protein [Thermoanaerobacterium]|uniref:Phosphopantetheine-protein transferase n=2 Tax=Thermoanaerobacterium TaxID=28895 RepID=W9EFI9_9THEO|nr:MULTISPECIES: 4'-phosphopantetheinyl transferase superfamily protein [Thermoanaerobacterium]AFK86393.1 phosphopantetheine-protein transferase [Thermoanaerobacterium saccharolyticum JW/SL-YS485]ETO38489.1 phosphopantetheine-protein transferase [Thermoanaerobacterium aotearoense SCUT27]